MTVSPAVERIRRPHWSLARTWLLQPGLPAGADAFDAAVAGKADVVVLDVEDGLPDVQKPAGRQAVAEWLYTGGRAWVRISSVTTAAWRDDLDVLAGAPGLAGVMLAKAESADEVAATAARLPDGTPVVALIESALGIESALDIARAPACARIAFGIGDFRRDTGMSGEPAMLAYPRARLVIASRAAGLPAPIDGPTLRNRNAELPGDTVVAKSAGMTGRLCLNRNQVDLINRQLAPSDDELTWAQEMLEAHAAGASVGDGSYLPRLARAQKIADLADSYGLWNA